MFISDEWYAQYDAGGQANFLCIKQLSYLLNRKLSYSHNYLFYNQKSSIMRTVEHIFMRKGHHNITVDPGISVLGALKIIYEKNVGSVIVMDNKGKYCGLVTERDYARKVILLGKSSGDTQVDEIMLEHLPKITPEHTLEECMSLMTAHNIRYLPVFKNNEFYGVISILDIVKETILAQQETIDHLHSYIHSV